ncbi:hypothetical protein, variant [Capsaspora owczarzaki ATCC 30864]|uniref:NOD3 protein n=1 Tax=Capsaspora owczarzaki (strain ATCC 30864) TaxID=595528 RepID=A0A0D2WSK5_CAPO3|nr:hypothetical protein, variant [Capsaspora owczarzaki ATCC 30864]
MEMNSLDRKQIGDAEAQAIAEGLKVNTTVHTLGLYDNQIGDAGAIAIAGAFAANPKLQKLSLYDNRIGDAGARAIAEAIKGSCVWELNLQKNQIGDAGAQAIAETLDENSRLMTLTLWKNRIGDVGATAIAEALKENTTLCSLKLGENQIGDAGAQAIGEALKVNSDLTRLNLQQNQIGHAGAQAIGEALKVNTCLSKLTLYGNRIGDAGAQAIAEALKVNSSIQELDLSSTQIGDAGALALAERMVHSELAELDLGYNRIGDVGAQAIAKAIKDGATLTGLYLSHNCIGDAAVDLITEAQEIEDMPPYLTVDPQINPLAFSLLPRLATADDLQTVLCLLTSGPELQDQLAVLPALPTEIAELIMDEASYWQGVQPTKPRSLGGSYPDPRLEVTMPRSIAESSIRVKAIQLLRDWETRTNNIGDNVFDLTVRDEQGAVQYECAVQPTFVDSNLALATIWPASTPILRQMREGWQVQVRPSKAAHKVCHESLYVGYV